MKNKFSSLDKILWEILEVNCVRHNKVQNQLKPKDSNIWSPCVEIMEDIKQARDFFFIYWLFMYILFGSEGLILTFEQVKFKNSNGIPIRCISYQFLKRRSEIKKKYYYKCANQSVVLVACHLVSFALDLHQQSYNKLSLRKMSDTYTTVLEYQH